MGKSLLSILGLGGVNMPPANAPRAVRRYTRSTAPSEAEETSAAYFANTPPVMRAQVLPSH